MIKKTFRSSKISIRDTKHRMLNWKKKSQHREASGIIDSLVKVLLVGPHDCTSTKYSLKEENICCTMRRYFRPVIVHHISIITCICLMNAWAMLTWNFITGHTPGVLREAGTTTNRLLKSSSQRGEYTYTRTTMWQYS